MKSIEKIIADELGVKESQVIATIKLLDEGSTVPFIARYRKEITGGLIDDNIRKIEERLKYLRELSERKETVISSINEQGKMTPLLLEQITSAMDKTTLEDIYLPYKPKRRTKSQIAIEAGLQKLADAILKNPSLDPIEEAKKYLCKPFKKGDVENPGVVDEKAALEGARAILIDTFGEDAEIIQELRTYVIKHGVVDSEIKKDKEEAGEKFKDYFKYSEPLTKIPSHRALALFRGEKEGFLSLNLRLDSEPEKRKSDAPLNHPENNIAFKHKIKDLKRPSDEWLLDTVRLCWRAKIFPHIETGLMSTLREHAEEEAIRVFAQNLKALLLASPAGHKVTLGLDPGIRTGVKVAVVDETGKVLDFATIYPHEPKRDWDGSLKKLKELCVKHKVTLISIGNGTASRETDKLAEELIKNNTNLKLSKLVVSEAGASVYSASELARKELPDLDVSIRGAVSIARRLQDPLAELVKIDPKSIGVGQYQHDVNQSNLGSALDNTIEDCVNMVGVDVNTASPALLSHISGLSKSIADNIVAFRDKNGAFKNRKGILKVPRLGDKAFEQAAGFLRITSGDNPLDASAVHPESYSVVEKIQKDTKINIKDLIGNTEILSTLNPSKYTDENFGIPTVTDIIKELEKPGRDPRPEFKTATFKEGVSELKDLEIGMKLEGVVTNVAAFGAFVDIGVHQDGLVHISMLSDSFVKDPHTIVKVGQVVNVTVVDVDVKRKRIALSMK